jgi:3-hydroxybutyryl-CoA dehydrogenase
VTVVEAGADAAEHARARIEKSLDRGLRSGKLTAEDRATAAERLAFSTDLEDLEDADAAIEAIIEHAVQARALHAPRRAHARGALAGLEHVVVPIMKLGAGTSKPERVSVWRRSGGP